MRRALDLAARGRWTASPNPAVGAVVSREGEVLGEGFHERPGTAHAEVVALRRAGVEARGAELHVTLEPCDHHGRTPPCTRAIIEAGIRRVVCAMADPHPRVNGRGIARLQEAGVTVVTGVLEAEAEELNRRYVAARRAGRPVVVAKVARTLDGRIGTREGQPLRVSGPEALEWVGRRRSEVDGVLVGSATLLADDPRLTARRPDGSMWERQPARIVADARLRTGEGARLLTEQGGAVIILTSPEQIRSPRADGLRALGVKVEAVPRLPGGGLDPARMMTTLARLGMESILVEGGGRLLSSMEDADIIDLWQVWVAPAVMGEGRGMLTQPTAPRRLGPMQAVQVGGDLLVTALPESRDGKEEEDVHRDR